MSGRTAARTNCNLTSHANIKKSWMRICGSYVHLMRAYLNCPHSEQMSVHYFKRSLPYPKGMDARLFIEGMVRAEGLEPSRAQGSTDFRTSYGFHRPHSRGLWSGLSLHPSRKGLRCCPSSLYTFPAERPGLARDRHLKGFPEFEQFYIPGFPKSTQVRV